MRESRTKNLKLIFSRSKLSGFSHCIPNAHHSAHGRIISKSCRLKNRSNICLPKFESCGHTLSVVMLIICSSTVILLQSYLLLRRSSLFLVCCSGVMARSWKIFLRSTTPSYLVSLPVPGNIAGLIRNTCRMNSIPSRNEFTSTSSSPSANWKTMSESKRRVSYFYHSDCVSAASAEK